MKFLPVKLYNCCAVINFQPSVFKNAFICIVFPHNILYTAYRRPKSCRQLYHTERLCEIIVRSHIKSCHLVFFIASCTDHNDGGYRPGTDFPDHFNSIHIRKPKIHKNNIRIIGCSQHNCLRAVLSRIKLILFHFQSCGDQVADRLIVFHNKNYRLSVFYHNRISSCSSAK